MGTYRTVNIMPPVGTVTSGSFEASQALVDEVPSYVIDFSMTASIPQTLAGYNQGFLSIMVDMAGLQNPDLPATYIATVNGQVFTDPSGSGATIPIALGDTTSIQITYHAVIPGSPSTTSTMKVVDVSVKVPTYLDPGTNLLCDGSMETWPLSRYWTLVNGGSPDDFGRLSSAFQTGLENGMNGFAACSAGQQALGNYFKQAGAMWYSGQPIKQRFHWDGGGAQWKFRVRAGIGLGAVAHVWIMDSAGTNVADLFSDTVGGQWKLKTGALELDGPSDYWMVMDASSNIFQTIYYDDVAFGSKIDTECQEDFNTLPTVNTPTKTPDNLKTSTPTPTLRLTKWPTGTPTVTGTATTSPTVTGTARSTRTATVGPTLTATWGPSSTVTRTPYGTPHNPTKDPNATSTPEGTPAATGTPIFGDYPPGTVPGTGDCTKPANQWSLAWWLDYEVCRVLYAFSWQPVHSATVVALPAAANTYEPFRTAYGIGQGINAVKTEIATAVYGSTPFVNTGGPQTPIPNMFKAPANSPWNGAKFTVPNMDPRRNTASMFGTYCSHKMITVLGSVMAPGFCFVLNMLRDLGVLIWFQYLIDIAFALSVVRQILATIKFYPILFNVGKDEKA